MSLIDWISDLLFRSARGGGAPADQKPHDARGDETIDPATGIGEADGQILDNTSIDPTIQDREHGFPVSDPLNPEKGK